MTLSEGGAVKSRSGAMIEMGGRINLQGQSKFSLKKMFTGGTMIENVYTGSGLVTLAPVMLGDIATLRIDGSSNWRVGRHGFLGATVDVVKEAKSQGLGKALFSGEDLFVYNVSGNGLMWVSSFGAIIQREVSNTVKRDICNVPLTNFLRLQPVRHTSWTMVILWHGIVNTRSRKQEEACSPLQRLEKASCVGSQDQALSTSKHAT